MDQPLPQLQPPFGQREPMYPGAVAPVSVNMQPPQVVYAPVPPPVVPETAVQFDLRALWDGLDSQQQHTFRHGLEAGASNEEIAKYVPLRVEVIAAMRAAWNPPQQPVSQPAPQPAPQPSLQPALPHLTPSQVVAVASVSRVTKKHREALAALLRDAPTMSLEDLARSTGLTPVQVAKEVEKLKKAEVKTESEASGGSPVAEPPHVAAAGNALQLQPGMRIGGTPDRVPLEMEMLAARGLMLTWDGQAWLVQERPASVQAVVEQFTAVDREAAWVEPSESSWSEAAIACVLQTLRDYDLPTHRALNAFARLVDGLKTERFTVEALERSLTKLLDT